MIVDSAALLSVVNEEETLPTGCGDEAGITPILESKRQQGTGSGAGGELEVASPVVPRAEALSETPTYEEEEDTSLNSLGAQNKPLKPTGQFPRQRRLSLRSLKLQRKESGWRWGRFWFRSYDDDDEQLVDDS